MLPSSLIKSVHTPYIIKKLSAFALFFWLVPLFADSDTKEDNNTNSKAQELKFSPYNNKYLTTREYYNDYLKDKTLVNRALTLEKKVELAKKAFLKAKYAPLKKEQIANLFNNFGPLLFIISFALTCTLAYFAQEWLIEYIPDTLNQKIVRVLRSLSGNSVEYHLQGEVINKPWFIVHLLVAIFNIFYCILLPSRVVAVLFLTFLTMFAPFPLGGQIYVFVYIIIQSISRLMKYQVLLVEPLRFIFYSEALDLDAIEGAELLFVQKRAEGKLSDAQIELIIDKLIDARKYPEKQPYLYKFISVVAALPTEYEMDKPQGTLEIKDLSRFKYFPKQAQDLALRVSKRYKEGIRVPFCILNEGPPGVGKNLFARRLAEAIGAELIIVSTAMSIEDLEGEAPSEKGGGKLGVIGEALLRTKSGKPCIILFDEIDNSVQARGRPLIEFLLKLLDPDNKGTYYLKYLGGERCEAAKAKLPLCVMFNSNADLGSLDEALVDRFEKIRYSGYSWEQKIKMVEEELLEQVYCVAVDLDPKTLTSAHRAAVRALLKKMEEEDNKKPENERDVGMRSVDQRVKELLEQIKMEQEFDE